MDAPALHVTQPVPTLQLGGALSALGILGTSPNSDWAGPPSPGNDFFTRYEEDLELLAGTGVRSIRLGLDWSRLQPVPGKVDDDWREWYQSVFLAAAHNGIAVWATLHERSVPAWFDDEGSFSDSRTAGLAWPRWVETAAELFGDDVAGWFPIIDPVSAAARWTADTRKHEVALINMAVAWRDAWRILQGGPPVSTALGVRMVRPTDGTVPAQNAARFEDHVRWTMWLRGLRDGTIYLPNGTEREVADLGGSLDRLGIVTSLDVPEGTITDDTRRRWEERLGSLLRRAAEEGPDRSVMLAGIDVRWANNEERRLFVESTVHAIRGATSDGIPLDAVFVDPAISPRDAHVASLVDRDRNPTGDTDAWLVLTPPARGTD